MLCHITPRRELSIVRRAQKPISPTLAWRLNIAKSYTPKISFSFILTVQLYYLLETYRLFYSSFKRLLNVILFGYPIVDPFFTNELNLIYINNDIDRVKLFKIKYFFNKKQIVYREIEYFCYGSDTWLNTSPCRPLGSGGPAARRPISHPGLCQVQAS